MRVFIISNDESKRSISRVAQEDTDEHEQKARGAQEGSGQDNRGVLKRPFAGLPL
jgi:hypothetical protein